MYRHNNCLRAEFWWNQARFDETKRPSEFFMAIVLPFDGRLMEGNVSGANQSLRATVQTSNLNHIVLIQRDVRSSVRGIWKSVISSGRLSVKLSTPLRPLDQHHIVQIRSLHGEVGLHQIRSLDGNPWSTEKKQERQINQGSGVVVQFYI
jgi:hypothetical protein